MKITAGQSIYQIELTGSFAKKGLGFSCMRKAIEARITGQLEYVNEGLIQILARGEPDDIDEMSSWFATIPEIKTIKCRKVYSSNKQFNDFIIINSI